MAAEPSEADLALLTDEAIDGLLKPALRSRLVDVFHITPPTSGAGSHVADLKAQLKFSVSRAKASLAERATEPPGGAATRAAAAQAELAAAQRKIAELEAAQALQPKATLPPAQQALEQQVPHLPAPRTDSMASPPPQPTPGALSVLATPSAPSPPGQAFDLQAFLKSTASPPVPTAPSPTDVVDLASGGAAAAAAPSSAGRQQQLFLSQMQDNLEAQNVQTAAATTAAGFATLCKHKQHRMREFGRLLGISTLCKTTEITTRTKSPAEALPVFAKALEDIFGVVDLWATEMCVAEKHSFGQANAFAAESAKKSTAAFDASGIEQRIDASGFTVRKFPKSGSKKRGSAKSSSDSDGDDSDAEDTQSKKKKKTKSKKKGKSAAANVCHTCGGKGHFARDCPSTKEGIT